MASQKYSKCPASLLIKDFSKINLKSNVKMQGGISSEKENIKKAQATQAKNSISAP